MNSLICSIIAVAIINYMRPLVIYYAELIVKRAILMFIYTLLYKDTNDYSIDVTVDGKQDVVDVSDVISRMIDTTHSDEIKLSLCRWI